MDPIDSSFDHIGAPEEAEPGTFGAQQSIIPGIELPPTKNLAKDPDIVQRVQDELIPIIRWTRSNRGTKEAEWNAIRRMRMMAHDDGQAYFGQSNAYVPVYARNRQTLISSIAAGLFPSDDYMDVAPMDDSAGDAEAKAVKQYLQWEFECVAQLKRRIKPFLGQYVDYGNAVIKHRYKKELRSVGKKVKSKLSDGSPAGINELMATFRPTKTYDGLCVSTPSIFNWYIFPLSAETIDEASLIFEDVQVSTAEIEKMGRLGRWENTAVALATTRPTDKTDTQGELQTARGHGGMAEGELSTQKLGTRFLTEVWTLMQLPKDQYMSHEDPEDLLPVRLVLAGDTVLECMRMTNFSQKPPYEFSRIDVEPGMVYGDGFGRLVRSLQYLVNDFVNQTNDNGIYGMNPVTLVNPGFLAGPLRALSPGVTWYLTDVQNGVKFDRPPIEQVQHGLSMINAIIGMAQDFGGAPPVLQGMGGKNTKTATGMQILQNNARGPLQDLIEDLEQDVMVRLMRATWFNAQQYRETEVMTRVAGITQRVDPRELIGNFDFRWMASSQAMNRAMRAQQLSTFAQLLLNPATLQALAMRGKTVDPEPMLRRIWTDGHGQRGFEQIVVQAPMAPPGMPGAPGGMPGAEPPPGQEVRSATEQAAGGGSGEMVPGEGEEFMDVRGEADQLAAMLGGMQG
jgi:hypothetical protein